MFCPNCNAEYKDVSQKMTRKNPAMHMTTGFKIAGDNKTYLHCAMCGYNEVDPDAEQPKESVDPVDHLELGQKHDLLKEAHDKLQAENATLAQQLAATNAELKKAQAKLAEPPAVKADVAPGAGSFNPPANAAPVTPTVLPPAHSSSPGWEPPPPHA